MAKEQIAVAELITNIILGKNGRSQPGRFLPAKTKFPFDKPYEQPFPRATPRGRIFPLTCWPTCYGSWTLHTIQTCTISRFSEMERSSARLISPPTAAESGT